MDRSGLTSQKPFDAMEDDFHSWCAQLGTYIVDNLDDPDPTDPASPTTNQQIGEDSQYDTSREVPSNTDNYSRSPSPTGESGGESDDEGGSTNPLDIQSIAKLIAQTSRPGFFGSGDTSSTFSLHKKRKLTPTMKNMIGEAHLRFARGEQGLAAEICMEVIKEMPACSEPYHTLSIIYESQPEKSLQYLFIAAFLQPRGFKEWSRIAHMSLEFGNPRQALMCFKKAIRVDPQDVEIQLKYGQTLEDTGDLKGALRVYSKFISDFSNDGLSCVAALRRSACIYHKLEDIPRAHESLSKAFESFPAFITPSECNLMLDLCVSMKRYVEACQVLIKFDNVQFIPPLCEAQFETREMLSSALGSGSYDCLIPANFPVDLLAKLITVLVHLDAYSLTDKLGSLMSEKSVEIYGDLYLDIAESYMAKRSYERALEYLLPLIESETYSQAAVWLRYAECLFLLVRLEEAVVAYQQVVKRAPNRSLAKLNLAVILQKLGRTEDALETLRQDADEEYLDPELLLERCHILYKRRQFNEFVQLGTKLLSRHFMEIKDTDDALVIAMASNMGRRHASVLYDRESRGVHQDISPAQKFLEKEANFQQEYNLYLRLCRLFVQMERYDLLCILTYGACASTMFSQASAVETECEFQTFMASAHAGDDDILPQHMRVFLARYALSNLVLNLFGVVLHSCDHARYTRHVSRLLAKTPTDTRLILLNSHISFSTGAYKNALMEYMSLFCQSPTDPVIPLMISTVLLHVMSQKTSQSRVQLCINIVAFMRRYMELRGNCQEVYYNMGRIFHSMGLSALAISFYQLVLQTQPPAFDPDPIKTHFFQDGNILDVKREAAFNLAQIYRRSGAHDLARKNDISEVSLINSTLRLQSFFESCLMHGTVLSEILYKMEEITCRLTL